MSNSLYTNGKGNGVLQKNYYLKTYAADEYENWLT